MQEVLYSCTERTKRGQKTVRTPWRSEVIGIRIQCRLVNSLVFSRNSGLRRRKNILVRMVGGLRGQTDPESASVYNDQAAVGRATTWPVTFEGSKLQYAAASAGFTSAR